MGFGIVNTGVQTGVTYEYDNQGRITKVTFCADQDVFFGLEFQPGASMGTGTWRWVIGVPTLSLTVESGNLTFAPLITSGYNNLGSQGHLWTQIFTEQGGVQTSDRAEKTDIRYLADPVAAISDPHSDDSPDYDGAPAAADEITYADIEDFVRNLSAATFVYKSGVKDGEVDPAAVQLGLIADDICDHKLYPYIGTSHQTAEGTKRGLQPIPLAVAALAMCKRQAEQIDELTDRIAKLEATK